MKSDTKTAANRKNALKSTGPRTVRGKSKSRLNAVKSGVFATTPILPGEDEGAYREMEKLNREHFVPDGPVEDVLVRQITAEQWKLGRIEKASVALFEQLEEAQQTRFLRSLDKNATEFTVTFVNANSESRKRQESQVAAASDAAMRPVQGSGTAENLSMFNAADTKSIEDRLYRTADVGSRMLEALVPGTENAPQECLDRQQRTTMRIYLAYVDKLREFQEARRTVTVMPVPMAEQEAAPLTNARQPKPFPLKQAANRNGHGPSDKGTETSATIVRIRPQIRKGRGGSRINAAPESR